MKRKIGLGITLILILLVATCATYPEEMGRIPGNIRQMITNNTNTIDLEEAYRTMSLFRKIEYGSSLSFNFQRVVDGEKRLEAGRFVTLLFDSRLDYFNPFYTDVIFVHSEAEAEGFPENVIVGWPIDDDRLNEASIALMHWEVNRTEAELGRWGEHNRRPVVTLEEFGLTYPITLADLVDNWDKVASLREAVRLMPTFSIPSRE